MTVVRGLSQIRGGPPWGLGCEGLRYTPTKRRGTQAERGCWLRSVGALRPNGSVWATCRPERREGPGVGSPRPGLTTQPPHPRPFTSFRATLPGRSVGALRPNGSVWAVSCRPERREGPGVGSPRPGLTTRPPRPRPFTSFRATLPGPKRRGTQAERERVGRVLSSRAQRGTWGGGPPALADDAASPPQALHFVRGDTAWPKRRVNQAERRRVCHVLSSRAQRGTWGGVPSPWPDDG